MLEAFSQASSLSLAELRARISGVRFGPIDGEAGTILFEFDGVTHSAPEPTSAIIGHSVTADQSIALRTLLDKQAKVIIESPFNCTVESLCAELRAFYADGAK